LLPRWRGAAPVERAILAGDPATAVCVMDVEEGLDTGGTYACETVEIGPDETADELRGRLVEVGTRLLVDTLRQPLGEPTPQEGEPTYAAKIDAAELRLDWSQPPEQLARVVRLGGAWTTFNGKRLKVLRARPSDDGTTLDITEVQPEGKGPMAFADWARGAHWQPGDAFGT
jgi:methionyl-tRNA formyltransferase